MANVIDIIKANLPRHFERIANYEKASLYYRNQNDILRQKSPANQVSESFNIDPLRNADNRISHNWFNLLVNQKAGYLFSYAPHFDLSEPKLNNKIRNILGDDFAKICKDLCIDASCYGSAYLHYWNDNGFNFASIDASQIIPIYSGDIRNELTAVIRVYHTVVNDKQTLVYEYWNDSEMYCFYEENGIKPYFRFDDNSYFFKHGFNKLPFIEFKNNNLSSSDLDSVKSLIDVYDKVFSGFVNDIEDIQQVILVLTNYGGQDLQSFLADLKRYKAIDMQTDENSVNSGISTMSIDIPIEARREILSITRKQIFVSGQGIDPQNELFNNTSGVALRHLYGLLELKCGLMEAEFRSGFNKLIRAILASLNNHTSCLIEQNYKRAYIQNDLEKAEILCKLSDFTSDFTLAKNNPLVEDFEKEILYLKGDNNETNND